MASLKEIRTRITSVKSTKQITSAMKMVAAAKLRKAQASILQMRPYANKLHEILTHVSSDDNIANASYYTRKSEEKKVVIVLIASNKGLCGAFNSNIVKRAITLAEERYKKQNSENNLDFIVIGKKAIDLLKSRDYGFVAEYNDIFDELRFDNVVPIAEMLMEKFRKGDYDKIEIVYNAFKNAATQIVTDEVFLPVEVDTSETIGLQHDYIFEPSQNFIIETLIPKSLKIQLYKALLDSNAAEHGARMTAMHKATDNANDLLRELSLKYNKARQASITNEILEIVGGAEALHK